MLFSNQKKQINLLSSKLKEEINAKHFLVLGLIIIILYKVWKNFIMGFRDPGSEVMSSYYFDQAGFSLYRAIASIIGLLLIKKNYRNFKIEFLIGNKKIAMLNFMFLTFYFFLKLTLHSGFSFHFSHFSKEFLFNFLTGSFEEIIFRGILLVALAQYFRPIASILLSSVLFSLWHYDVITSSLNYIDIFLWSAYAGLCFYLGASLFSLILVHFIWDQLHFGFDWEFLSDSFITTYTMLYNLLIIIFLIFIYVNFYRDKRHLS